MIRDYIKARKIIDIDAEVVARKELYQFFKDIVELAKKHGGFKVIEKNHTLLQVKYGVRSNARATDFTYISITLLGRADYSLEEVNLSDTQLEIVHALIESIEANAPECNIRAILKAKVRKNSGAISIKLRNGLSKLVTGG